MSAVYEVQKKILYINIALFVLCVIIAIIITLR